MVSFWPWKGDANSAESFEKQLSALAIRIAKASNQNDRLRQRARMLKVGWILWGGVSYIITSALLFWTHGWQNWGPIELAIVLGGPVILYVVRYLLNSWYHYRTTNSQEHLEGLYKERDATIEKLKQATKYDTTQQLLEKYGSAPKKVPVQDPATKRPPRTSTGRTQMPVPPTANIRRNPAVQGRESVGQAQSESDAQQSPVPVSRDVAHNAVEPPATSFAGEEFAPNAFDGPPKFSSSTERHMETHWYDRIFDALLGEDESSAKNRLALICKRCRIVNGLAPPGVRTPEELGKWRCSGCGTWNGEVFEASQPIPDANRTGLKASETEPTSDGAQTLRERLTATKATSDNDEDG